MESTKISVLHVSLAGVPVKSVTLKISQEIDEKW